ncbi:3-hydroxyacyl-CoA dehydrogenase NAD-binding domain-containing protein [Allorhizocola rhizosphaerae]|uniref:3-hydroxyacyl-CoA dehydrogenase NAD-binding domain-containing protein n=1 Tax=Allorhizocola rhizosphaerae TaxID=1872709 RepID=UPI000E3D6B19|nr:3-hydroxyacyl-CoA dehydrogenase NAD-binding domain-containing protein [Allorhizocola rhizosphaerae]
MSELVTASKLRFVNVGLGKPAALITLDNGFDHTKPNTFGPAGLSSLASAVDEALAAEPAFIAVTGKPYIFCVGFDLTTFNETPTREQALELGRMGHRAFARLRESTVPTFAFVNGAAMGGGLEVALHCHYRTVSGGAAALALPEVLLGLIPGWGGSQLLPNLVGILPAIQVIVQNPLMQNKMLRPKQALEMGMFDKLFEPADFLESSLGWAASVVSGQTAVDRPEVDRSEMWDAILGFARAELDKRVHGAIPSANKALELLALAKEGPNFEAEIEALADLAVSPEARNGLYAFDLVQRRAKKPVGAPSPGLAAEVTKVGIVGAGLMAAQIGLLFLRKLEVPVVLTDLDQERVDKGLSYVHAEIDKLVSKKRLSAGKAAKLRRLVSGSVSKDAFADAELVIEAVFEEMSVKKRVWAEVEEIVSPECILATNTSSLSITEMAADLKHPSRVVGLHFFNPVAVMPLLEIVRGERTDDVALATAFAVGKKLGKSCVLVKDAPAFVANRIFARFLGTIWQSVDEGTPFDVADRALDPLGLPMRPSAFLSLVGAGVAAHVGAIMHDAYPDRFPLSPNMSIIAKSGLPILVDDEPNPALIEQLQQGDRPLTEEQVRDRALKALAEEITIMLQEGVVAEAADIDLCMIVGGGWPFHLGGITPYLKQHGYL